MRNFFVYPCLLCIVLFFVNCDNINDFHDIYLKKGETIYFAKVDTVEAYAGNQRILLRIHAKNPKMSNVAIFWNQRSDSLIVPLENRVSPDYFDVIIDNLEEKDYVFEIYARDERGHTSILYEQLGKVYGEVYLSTLISHPIEFSEFDPLLSTLSLSWFPVIDSTGIGVEFKYQNSMTGLPSTKFIAIEDFEDPNQITEIDRDSSVLYRTYFLPETQAIDTFLTDFKHVELSQIVNVALNKPVSIREGDILASKYVPENATDGIISHDSRWLSNAHGEHWIVVDLLQEYNISSFKTYIGANGNFVNPVSEFYFQVDIDGQWKDVLHVVGNKDPQYSAEFPEIATSKVRYFVPDAGSTDNMVRLYEIEVYSKIIY